MSTAVALTDSGLGGAIEKALMTGDLSSLTVEQRLQYYNATCQSLGLNPLTRPFDYIVLNNKLTLYAKKDCTDQLRRLHGISVRRLEKESMESVYAVTAYVQGTDGRDDSSIGAVSIVYPERIRRGDGSWVDHPRKGQTMSGEDLANALMKAETKSKRRATLSICGLGMLDETEVQDLREQGVAGDPLPAPTVVRKPVASESAPEIDVRPRPPKAAPVPEIEPPQNAQQGPPQQQGSGEATITEKQGKMLFAIQRSVGISDEECKRALAGIGWSGHRDQLPKRMFQQALDAVDSDFRFHARDNGR